MDNEAYSFALKTTLNEIRNICPDITNAFIFADNGEIIAGDETTQEKIMVQVVNAFNGILDRADKIGGVECITLEGSNGRMDVSHINDIYFVTVTSKKADITYVNTVTRVLIPTVLRLLEKICPAPLKNNPPPPQTELEIPPAEEPEETAEEEIEETIKPQIEPEPILPEPPVNQLIVENLGGLLVPSDTVRIDSTILSQWETLYEDRKIEEVEIETFDGKTARCKVKPIKDSKHEGKGVIQIPEKMQIALEIKKGELVRAKPVIE
jgi:predicted regulator of Ras-like GTPase activity (Roadblock/LC7/MglB family)